VTDLSIDYDAFPIRVDACTPNSESTQRIYRAVATALGLADDVIVPAKSSWVRLDLRATATGLGVARIVKAATEKSSGAKVEVVVVQYAILDAEGQPVAVSPDLDARQKLKPVTLCFTTPRHKPIAIAEAVKAYLSRTSPATTARKAAKPPREKPTSESRLRNVQVSPDRTTIATLDNAQNLRVWDVETGDVLWTKSAGKGGVLKVSALCYSPDGTRIACGKSKVAVYSTATGDVLSELAGHPKGEIRWADWAGDRIALQAWSGTARGERAISVTDAGSGEILFKREVVQGEGVALSAEATALYFLGELPDHEPMSVTRFDLETGAATSRALTGYGMTRTDAGLLTLTDDGLEWLEPESLETIASIALAGPARGSLFMTAGRSGPVTVMNRQRALFDVGARGKATPLRLPELGEIVCASRSADGTILVVAAANRLHIVKA
jgi:WD40 repeat protein